LGSSEEDSARVNLRRSRYRNQTEASPVGHFFAFSFTYSHIVVRDASIAKLTTGKYTDAVRTRKKRGSPMSVVAKDPIAQLTLGPAQAVPWLLVNTPAASMRMMDPKEMRNLSQFAAVIVLISERATNNEGGSGKAAGNRSLDIAQRQWRRERACLWRCESELFLHGGKPQR
jgi:hypothetical protein